MKITSIPPSTIVTQAYRSRLKSKLRDIRPALRLVERRAYPTLQTVDLQQVLLEQFVIGVSDPEVRKNLLRQQPSTLDDAVCLALQEALHPVCAAPPRDLLRVASVRQKLADDVGTLQSFLAAPAPRGRTTGADKHPVAPPVLRPAVLFSQSTSSSRTATMITALRLVERRAYPTLQTVDLQQVLLEQFVIGVSDPEVRKNLLRQQPSTLDDAVCLALQEALQAVCAAPPRDLLRVASVRQKLADDVGTLQSFLAAPAPRGRTTGADIHPVAPPVLGPAALFSQSTSSLRTATMITALRLVERRAYPTLQTVNLQQVLLEQFVIGVSDPEVRKNLLRQQPSTLDDAVCLALQEALQAVCAAPPRDLLRVASVRQKLADDVGTLQSFLAAPAPRGRTTGADIHPVAPPVLGPAALFSQSTSSLRTATMITALRLVERRAYPTLQTVSLQQVLFEQFVIGVSDPEVRKNLLRQQPSTLDDAVCLALQEALQAVCAAPPRDLLRVASVRQKLADDVGTLQSFLAAPAPRGRTTGADIHPVAPPVLGPAALFSQSTSSLRTATMITLTSDGETGSSLGTLKANSFVLDFRSNLPFFVNLGRTASQKSGYAAATSNVSPGAEISNLAPRDHHSVTTLTRSRNPSLNSILWPLEVSFKMQWQD
ncbi:hypothetical protein SprV_0301342100 [Sparganum proliferum]